MKKITRRNILTAGLGAGALMASKLAKAQDFCAATPRDGEGPFHPTRKQILTTLDQDSDLTFVKGRTGSAVGQLIFVSGVLRDQDCNPINGAKIRIWQANKWGLYNHPGDTSGKQKDPEFQGWGEFITKEDGKFLFKTILPGEYGPGNSENRRRHLHYKVYRPDGSEALTTQMYFTQNHPLTSKDLSGERPHPNLVRNFSKPPVGSTIDPNSFLVDFPISIRL